MRFCSIEGCGKKRHAREMCNMHYTHWRVDPANRASIGTYKPKRFTNMQLPACSGPECTNQSEHYTSKYCGSHRKQMNRTGKVTKINSHRQTDKCNVPDCERESMALNLCRNHYYYRYYMQVPEDIEDQCSVEGCNLRTQYKGLCIIHKYMGMAYQQGVLADNYAKLKEKL